MALIDLWRGSPEQVRSKRVSQVIAFAGDGKLRDGGPGSAEFRELLSMVPSRMLESYAGDCLDETFPDSGLALQDIVNEIGRRLGLSVSDGRYRGTSGQSGHDGVWRLPSGHAIVVEVKTTDAYRINLNILAGYRKGLVTAGTVSEDASSMLVVVGRQDTGDLEAQIRGSRFAWDVRIVSVQALVRLMLVKEELENPTIVNRIHQILVPREFTRLDEIVDVLFSTAADLKPEEEADAVGLGEEVGPAEKKFTPVAFHQECVKRIESLLGTTLVKRSRTGYATADAAQHLLFAVSREHLRSGQPFFWFAFHPHQQDFLGAAPQGSLVLGCGSAANLLLVPFDRLSSWLEGLNITDTGERKYWHVQVVQEGPTFSLLRKAGFHRIDLTSYFVPLQTSARH